MQYYFLNYYFSDKNLFFQLDRLYFRRLQNVYLLTNGNGRSSSLIEFGHNINEQLASISKCLKVNSPLPSKAKFIEES